MRISQGYNYPVESILLSGGVTCPNIELETVESKVYTQRSTNKQFYTKLRVCSYIINKFNQIT